MRFRSRAARSALVSVLALGAAAVMPTALAAQEGHAPNPQTPHDDPAREAL
jgi:hypothetical protein